MEGLYKLPSWILPYLDLFWSEAFQLSNMHPEYAAQIYLPWARRPDTLFQRVHALINMYVYI